MFELAESLGKTVGEMLAGGLAPPMTQMEFYLWNRYRAAQGRIRYQNQHGGNR